MKKQLKRGLACILIPSALLLACQSGSGGASSSAVTPVTVTQVGAADPAGISVEQIFAVGGIAYLTYINGTNESGNIISYNYIKENSASSVPYSAAQVTIPEELNYTAFGNLLFTEDQYIYLNALNLNESNNYQQVILKYTDMNQYESTIGILGESWSLASSYGVTRMGKLYLGYDSGDTEFGSLCNIVTTGFSTASCAAGVLPGWYSGEFVLKEDSDNTVYISKEDGLYLMSAGSEYPVGENYDSLTVMGIYIEPGLVQKYQGMIYIAGVSYTGNNVNLAVCNMGLETKAKWQCYAGDNYALASTEYLSGFALDQSNGTLIFQVNNYEVGDGKLYSLSIESLVNGVAQ